MPEPKQREYFGKYVKVRTVYPMALRKSKYDTVDIVLDRQGVLQLLADLALAAQRTDTHDVDVTLRPKTNPPYLTVTARVKKE